MKHAVLPGIVLVLAICGFALVFCGKEEPAASPPPASKTNAAGHGRFAEAPSPGRNPRTPNTKEKPTRSAPGAAPLTPEQEAAEKARLERIAAAKASFDQAVAANDPVAVASRDYLAANSQREGVVTTTSGLQYEVMAAGNGPLPAATDTVNVHYHGTLPDGTVFDSSVERGEPLTFPLTGVIAGWTEGVQLMPTGSKFKFSIPSWLAYGDMGTPPKIPAHSALVFEVELFAIEAK